MSSAQERLARTLVRLYPRAWRARYEAEMRALLEQSSPGFRRSFDLLGGAFDAWAREICRPLADSPNWRLASFLVAAPALGALVAGCGTLVALWLTAHVETPPVTWIENGQRLVLPPRLPAFFGGLTPVLTFLVLGRIWRALLPQVSRRPVRIVGLREFSCWIAALAFASSCDQWFSLVANLGTGLAPRSSWYVWSNSAVQLCMVVQFLLLSGRTGSIATPRPRPPTVPPARFPLGLKAGDCE